MASVVCVLVKICVSSILLYKLDTDKLTAPFESAHQFTLVCTVSDSKTVPGCHYNLCSNHSFVLTEANSSLCLFRAVFSLPGHSLPLLYTDLCLLRPWSRTFFFVLRALRKCSCHDRDSPSMLDPPPHDRISELLQVPNGGNGLGKMDQRAKLIDVIEQPSGACSREGGYSACLLATRIVREHVVVSE